MMNYLIDFDAGRLRQQDMLREAEQERLARQAARLTGNESLLSRMAKLLAGLRKRPLHMAQREAEAAQHRMASANPS